MFNARCDEMEGRFLRRGHHLKNVQEARARASNTPRSETLQYKPKQSTNRTPFIVTHHPSNPPLRSWFTELQTSVLHTSRRMQQALPPPPPSLGSATVSRCVHCSCRPSCPPRRTQTLAASDATSVHVSYAPATWWKHQPSAAPPPSNHFKSATDLHVKVLTLCTFSTATPANNHNRNKEYTQD